MPSRFSTAFCMLACTVSVGETVRQTVQAKQEVEGNGNKCLRKVSGYDSASFSCWQTKPCARQISSYQQQGYIGCVDLGCQCSDKHVCMKRPHYSGESFCLAAAATKELHAMGSKRYTTSSGEYVETTDCEFESFGFSLKHLTDTKGCIGNVIGALIGDTETAPAESFMDLTEHISFQDEASDEVQGNGNKCLGLVGAWNDVRFTCKTGSMAWMRQCAKKIQKYTAEGYISCQDLGCDCPKDYFCFRQPQFTKEFCLAKSEVENLKIVAKTDSKQSLFESEKLPTLQMLPSSACSFESFGFSTRHFTETKGCDSGPGNDAIVSELAELVKDGA